HGGSRPRHPAGPGPLRRRRPRRAGLAVRDRTAEGALRPLRRRLQAGRDGGPSPPAHARGRRTVPAQLEVHPGGRRGLHPRLLRQHGRECRAHAGVGGARAGAALTLALLPALNALLNATSAVLLATGYVLIRRRRRRAHHRVMIAALVTSALFLTSYLVYHAQVGSVRFRGQGPVRTVYFMILVTHTILAITIVPLVAFTLVPALRGRFDRHRRLARVTLPLWAYVS